MTAGFCSAEGLPREKSHRRPDRVKLPADNPPKIDRLSLPNRIAEKETGLTGGSVTEVVSRIGVSVSLLLHGNNDIVEVQRAEIAEIVSKRIGEDEVQGVPGTGFLFSDLLVLFRYVEKFAGILDSQEDVLLFHQNASLQNVLPFLHSGEALVNGIRAQFLNDQGDSSDSL